MESFTAVIFIRLVISISPYRHLVNIIIISEITIVSHFRLSYNLYM